MRTLLVLLPALLGVDGGTRPSGRRVRPGLRGGTGRPDRPGVRRAPDDLVTGGIDGLLAWPGGLLAVQNGIVTPRLVQLWLDPGGRRITRWKVLARGPELPDPTHVTPRRGGVLAVADSGWARFTDEGAVKPGAGPTRLRLFRLDLY